MQTTQRALIKFALTTALSLPVMGFAQSSTVTVEDARAAIRAVQSTLPSVAILGQKAGPADTTEVFIQVPGVLNMQSVYVLGDKQTVISGVVVPPIENGFPGSQLNLPTGQPTVDPRAPRSNLSDMNGVLGITPQANTVNEPLTVADTSPVTRSMPASPEVVVPSPSSETASAAQTKTSNASEPTVPAPTHASARASDATQPDVRASAAASDGAKVSTASVAGDTDPVLIESMDQVAESGAFGKIVATVIQNDADIDRVRSIAGEAAQQGAYLDLVRSLPAVVQGNADRKVYVMFDPNCPVCHRYYNEVSLEVAAGQLEVHWIPAIVFPNERSSLTASAALLAELDRADGDPSVLLRNVMTQEQYTQAIDDAPNVNRLVPYLGDVVKNTAVMAMARAETPLVIFENKDGNLAINPGIPRPGYTALVKRES